MAGAITYKERRLQLNNMLFARLIDFGIAVATKTVQPDEHPFLDRMTRFNDEFWPGRVIDIVTDFPNPAERKFWCRVFYDTSRAVFDRQVGEHEHSFWQAQTIHLAYATALLFREAVRETEPQWSANSIDQREFDRVVNRKDT